MSEVRVLCGDALATLKTLQDESVSACVTSPPYFNQRDYGCDGQIGMEKSPAEYVTHLIDVFREVRRVLRRDGTCWIVLGDSYAANRGNQVPDSKHVDVGNDMGMRVPDGLKEKDLIGIPWRVAFALQDDGWWLRSDCIWAKPNLMPESVTDRPTKSHEYIFLLAKSARYFYDAAAIAEPCQSGPSDIRKMEEQRERIGGKHKTLDDPLSKASSSTNIGQKRSVGDPSARNRRSVWTVATTPYPGAHFAVYPEKLIEPCILAGCRPGGVVLDPFAGSGTTGVVALRNNRDAILIELSPAYVELIHQRLDGVQRRLPIEEGV